MSTKTFQDAIQFMQDCCLSNNPMQKIMLVNMIDALKNNLQKLDLLNKPFIIE